MWRFAIALLFLSGCASKHFSLRLSEAPAPMPLAIQASPSTQAVVLPPPAEELILYFRYDFDVQRIVFWEVESSTDLMTWTVNTDWRWENNDPMTDTILMKMNPDKPVQFFRIHVMKLSE